MAGRGVFAVLALLCHTALAFKAHEFKTCDQNPFCKRYVKPWSKSVHYICPCVRARVITVLCARVKPYVEPFSPTHFATKLP
eukprot:3345563-Pyramimonas_sp.AAC.3